MLTSGLDILRILAEADAPLSATAIAERVGLHVSNVSRTLKVLIEHGYVRKPSYHSFAPDLGVLCLAGSAALRLPVIAESQAPLIAIAQDSGIQATLAALHQDQLLYLQRAQTDGHCISAVAGGFPLHRSVVGLRLLLDLPAARAERILEAAARRSGWERPTAQTPANPMACLQQARERLQDGVLRTDHWDSPGEIAIAMTLQPAGLPPLALSLDGPFHGSAPQMINQLITARKQLLSHLESL